MRVRLPDDTQVTGTLGTAVGGSESPARKDRVGQGIMPADGSSALFGEWVVTLDDGGEVTTAAATRISRVAPAKGQAARVVLGSMAGFAGVVLSADGDIAVVRAHLDRRVKVLPLDCLTRDRSADP